MNVIYRQILTARILAVSGSITTSAGGNSTSVGTVILHTRDGRVGFRSIVMSIGDGGTGVRDLLAGIRNGYLFVYLEFGLDV